MKPFLFLIAILLIANSSSTEEFNKKALNIRTSLFGKASAEPKCMQLSRGLDFSKLSSLDGDLLKFIEQLNAAIKKQDYPALAKVFHPRLKISESQLVGNFKSMAGAIGRPVKSVTPFRIWALQVPEGRPSSIGCLEDALAIAPHYGYELQFGVWIQVTGEQNLARIYTSIVPVNGQWQLGSWHFAQWTHAGKDAETWIQEAQSDLAQDKKIIAYLKFDLATKLLDGGGFIFSDLKILAEQARNSIYSPPAFLQTLALLMKNNTTLVQATSLFGKEGTGLIIRLNVDGQSKSEDLRKLCKDLGKNLYANKDLSELVGVRCSFVTDKENPEVEGRLGGRYLSKKEILR